MVSCTVCRRVKEPRAKVVVSMVFATTVGSQVMLQLWERQQKVGQVERDGQMARVGIVLVMEVSTQEKIVRDSNWCVPVKHVAKLNRMRRQTPTVQLM